MSVYIYDRRGWPQFEWDSSAFIHTLARLRNKQGRLLGTLETMGFSLREDATLETITQDVIKSSEIEGENLPRDEVRSSIARRLGMDVGGDVIAGRHVEGIVELMLDATQKFEDELTEERLFLWHSSLFPAGRNGIRRMHTGEWRSDRKGRMQVVSGAAGRERVHFEAPPVKDLQREMSLFIQWFNHSPSIDPVLKAAIAHLWFVTIHPFEDGNGRIARAIADMQLARADESKQRFYSMSAQIRRERNVYYEMLETTQKGNLDITNWISWFLDCLDRSIVVSEQGLSTVFKKKKFWESVQSLPLNERHRKVLNKLMDGFEGKLTTSKWAKLAKCSNDTALRDIQFLVEKGVLEKGESGGRSSDYYFATNTKSLAGSSLPKLPNLGSDASLRK